MFRRLGFFGIVRTYVERSEYLSLHEHYDRRRTPAGPGDRDCSRWRDILYTQWAAFIDFLIARHGLDGLHALSETSSMERTESGGFFVPPDFQAVYGAALNQLEAAWLVEIAGNGLQ